jgi:hypothetical protein
MQVVGEGVTISMGIVVGEQLLGALVGERVAISAGVGDEPHQPPDDAGFTWVVPVLEPLSFSAFPPDEMLVLDTPDDVAPQPPDDAGFTWVVPVLEP